MKFQQSITGNVSAAPSLKEWDGGDVSAEIGVMTSERFFNKKSQEWEDRHTQRVVAKVYGQEARNAVESLNSLPKEGKGARVVISGDMSERVRTYQNKENETVIVVEFFNCEVSVSTKWLVIEGGHKSTAANSPAADTIVEHGGEKFRVVNGSLVPLSEEAPAPVAAASTEVEDF